MAWSKVNHKHSKPLNWWYHKIICEIGWAIRHRGYGEMYYSHLAKCCKTGFNLYGQKIK